MEKSVQIGVKLISVILFFMFWFPIGAGGWTAYDAVDVLLHSEQEFAIYKRCERRSVISRPGTIRGSSSIRIVPSYFAIAQRDNGWEISDRFPNRKRKDCEAKIDNQVLVFVNKKNPENSRINTFHQFWILPIVGTLICLLFLYVTYRGIRWFIKT